MLVRIRLYILIIFLFPLFSACTSTLPPYMEGETYINSKFDFRLDLKNSWTIAEENPDWLKIFPDQMSSNKRIILENKKSGGVIFLVADTSSFNIDNFRWADTRFKRSFSDGFYGGFAESLDKNKAATIAQGDSFEHDVYRWGARNSPPEFAYYRWQRIKNETTIKEEGRFFIDSCKKNKTCIIGLILISEDMKFYENYNQFLEIIKSINFGTAKN